MSADSHEGEGTEGQCAWGIRTGIRPALPVAAASISPVRPGDRRQGVSERMQSAVHTLCCRVHFANTDTRDCAALPPPGARAILAA